MKKTRMKALSVASAGLLALSSITLSASANSSPDPSLFGLNTDKTALYTSMGFSEEQIRNIETASMVPNRYLAYYNFPADPTATSNSYFIFTTYLPINYSISSSDIVRGSGVSDWLIGYNTNYYSPTQYQLYTYHKLISTNADFPNVCRIKLTTNSIEFGGNISDPALAYMGITSGIVEAGNITAYIDGSTDTNSVINEDDSNRLLLHYAYMISDIEDTNWTDRATVAADLNFDNQITAADGQILLNALANGTDLW